MKNRKVRAQQIIMTVGCIGFLVWVGIRGMNEHADTTKETHTDAVKESALTSHELKAKRAREEVIVVSQVYTTTVLPGPSASIRASREGELLQLKVDINSRIEVGQEIALMRIAQADTVGLGAISKKAKVAEREVKTRLDQLLNIDRGEEGTDAKARYTQQYDLYNEAKKELAVYEDQIRKITAHVQYTEVPLKAQSAGVVKQILVGAGRTIENNQPILLLHGVTSKVIQMETTSERYLLLRDHLKEVTANLIFKDGSTLQLPTSILATLRQKAINEEGKIQMLLDMESIPNVQDIQKIEFRIPNISTQVIPELALFTKEGTTHIWTLKEDNSMDETPVIVVKTDQGKAYIQKGTAVWNHVLVGDFTSAKEGEPFTGEKE